eukprot:2933702-Alexandrium_andersonii.AAC.1
MYVPTAFSNSALGKCRARECRFSQCFKGPASETALADSTLSARMTGGLSKAYAAELGHPQAPP